MTAVTIYHNPACGTSRNVLALIRNAGIEPHIIEYLNNPPDRATLASLLERMHMPVRALLREKGMPYAELGLADEGLSDAQLLDAMMTHPILMNRPIVVTPWGVKLCRPSEALFDVLPVPQKGLLQKEGGELLVDTRGRRVGPENAM
jgi:arsenate reductase (glutaredoxin)